MKIPISEEKKINLARLHSEIAAAVGCDPREVSVQKTGGGTRKIVTLHGVREEPVEPHVEVVLPEGGDYAKAEAAVASHAPELDDAGELAAREAEELERKIMALPAVQSLLEELERLKGGG